MQVVGRSGWVYKYPLHFCLFDRQCRLYGAPKRIYFHFLKREDGSSFYISFDNTDKT